MIPLNKHKFSKARRDKVVPNIKRTHGMFGDSKFYKGVPTQERKEDRRHRKFGGKT